MLPFDIIKDIAFFCHNKRTACNWSMINKDWYICNQFCHNMYKEVSFEKMDQYSHNVKVTKPFDRSIFKPKVVSVDFDTSYSMYVSIIELSKFAKVMKINFTQIPTKPIYMTLDNVKHLELKFAFESTTQTSCSINESIFNKSPFGTPHISLLAYKIKTIRVNLGRSNVVFKPYTNIKHWYYTYTYNNKDFVTTYHHDNVKVCNIVDNVIDCNVLSFNLKVLAIFYDEQRYQSRNSKLTLEYVINKVYKLLYYYTNKIKVYLSEELKDPKIESCDMKIVYIPKHLTFVRLIKKYRLVFKDNDGVECYL